MSQFIDVDKVENMQKIKKNVPILVLVFFALILVFNSVGTVGAGERGVLLQFGAVQDKVLGEGLYFKIPFSTSQKMDVKFKRWLKPVLLLGFANSYFSDCY